MICSNRCVYCWRPTDSFDSLIPTTDLVDDPEELIQGVLRERYRLLTGYFGNPKSKERAKEALVPTHWSISLSGEPTLYPKLPQLVKYLKSLPNTKSVFIVTNGEHPEMLERLQQEAHCQRSYTYRAMRQVRNYSIELMCQSCVGRMLGRGG